MSILERLLYLIGLRPNPSPRTYEIVESLHTSLSTLAQHEGRPEHELLPDLLAAGLTQYHFSHEIWEKWESLSPRERDICALACLGFTNRQMAVRLGISSETVKTHIRSVLIKLDLHSKTELRLVFAAWDFSAWKDQM
jgi:DNA-binding CsgD family transcriptional regulator